MKKSEVEKAEAKARLLDTVKPGDTIYTVLRSVSRSGMFRRIDVYKLEDLGGTKRCPWNGHSNNEPWENCTVCHGTREVPRGPQPLYLTYNVAMLGIGQRPKQGHEGLGIGGCGMDMGFAIVHELSYALFSGSGYELSHEWL